MGLRCWILYHITLVLPFFFLFFIFFFFLFASPAISHVSGSHRRGWILCSLDIHTIWVVLGMNNGAWPDMDVNVKQTNQQTRYIPGQNRLDLLCYAWKSTWPGFPARFRFFFFWIHDLIWSREAQSSNRLNPALIFFFFSSFDGLIVE